MRKRITRAAIKRAIDKRRSVSDAKLRTIADILNSIERFPGFYTWEVGAAASFISTLLNGEVDTNPNGGAYSATIKIGSAPLIVISEDGNRFDWSVAIYTSIYRSER